MRFLNIQVYQGTHPTIGWAVHAELNALNHRNLEVVGMIHHPQTGPEERNQAMVEILVKLVRG